MLTSSLASGALTRGEERRVHARKVNAKRNRVSIIKEDFLVLALSITIAKGAAPLSFQQQRKVLLDCHLHCIDGRQLAVSFAVTSGIFAFSHMILANRFDIYTFSATSLLRQAGGHRNSWNNCYEKRNLVLSQRKRSSLQYEKTFCGKNHGSRSNMQEFGDSEQETDRLLLQPTEVPRNSFLYFFAGASNVFKADKLGWEIAVIAFPALLALAADPLASLVDTTFIGRIGSVELGAVGVSIAVFNFISKLLNFPVLNLTTSFVAEEDAISASHSKHFELETGNQKLTGIKVNIQRDENSEELMTTGRQQNLPSISTAIFVSAAIGLLEVVVLTWGAGQILDIMGVSADSDMRVPAEQYLAFRAIGAPAVVVSLAVQGVFRGFRDTKTPLYATVSGDIANIILDPIMMFNLQLGVTGAAIATVFSQYLIALILLWKLNQKVLLLAPKFSDLELDRFLKNGSLLLARSTAVMISMTLATSEAARLGAVPMAAHQICMQVWLAASLLSDAIALAGQAIIAAALATGDFRQAKDAAFRTLHMGLAFGTILAVALGVGLKTFSRLITNDSQVLEIITVGIPFVAFTQPINALAFIFDGIHFGASDFAYAAYSMIFVAVTASFCMLLLPQYWGFVGVWTGLTLLMTLRMFAGLLRIGTASGPWKFLK